MCGRLLWEQAAEEAETDNTSRVFEIVILELRAIVESELLLEIKVFPVV